MLSFVLNQIEISRSEVMQQLITINVSPNELNVGNKSYQKAIHDMVYNYKPPTMIKPTAIKSKIILSDDEPVTKDLEDLYQRRS